MNQRYELAEAFERGLDEGERRAAHRTEIAEHQAALMRSQLEQANRNLRATQSRLADREKLIYGLIMMPESFRRGLLTGDWSDL